MYIGTECPLCNTLSSREHIFYSKECAPIFLFEFLYLPVRPTDNVTYYMQIFQIERNPAAAVATRFEHFIYCHHAQGDKSRNDTFLFYFQSSYTI